MRRPHFNWLPNNSILLTISTRQISIWVLWTPQLTQHLLGCCRDWRNPLIPLQIKWGRNYWLQLFLLKWKCFDQLCNALCVRLSQICKLKCWTRGGWLIWLLDSVFLYATLFLRPPDLFFFSQRNFSQVIVACLLIHNRVYVVDGCIFGATLVRHERICSVSKASLLHHIHLIRPSSFLCVRYFFH